MEYEKLYDKIQDVSNEVHNFVGSELLKVDDNVCCPYCRSEEVSFIDETNDYYCPECHNSFSMPDFVRKTRDLLDKLSECVSEMSSVAHELEEHLAWDKR